MTANEEVEIKNIDKRKKALYESYLNYMMIPESSIYDYDIVEILPEELEEERLEEKEEKEKT